MSPGPAFEEVKKTCKAEAVGRSLHPVVRLWRRFLAWANQPTESTGPCGKVQDEAVRLLRSIDLRLATLERCVKPGIKHRQNTPHIVTGHWND